MASFSGFVVAIVDGQRTAPIPVCDSPGDRIPDRVFAQVNELPG